MPKTMMSESGLALLKDRVTSAEDQEAILRLRTNFATHVRSAREGAEISVAEAAKRLGVTKATVQRWEDGSGFPTIEIGAAYCKIINTDISNILRKCRC